MLFFNKKLLEGIPEDRKDICKFLLFAIEEDMRMDEPLINKRTAITDRASVFWKDGILMEVQDLLEILEYKKVISRDLSYGNEPKRVNVRWILNRPLYVTEFEDDLTDELITEIRSYFRRDYCKVDRGSSPALVKQHLSIFLEKNPTDIEIIQKAFKNYIDNKLHESEGKYIANILNFINHKEVEDYAGKDLKEYSSLRHRKKNSLWV